jgi:hypothetical protein
LTSAADQQQQQQGKQAVLSQQQHLHMQSMTFGNELQLLSLHKICCW